MRLRGAHGGAMAPLGLAWWALPWVGTTFGVSWLQVPDDTVSGGGSGTAVPAVSRSSSSGLGAAFQGFPAAPLLPGSESFSRGSGGSTG